MKVHQICRQGSTVRAQSEPLMLMQRAVSKAPTNMRGRLESWSSERCGKVITSHGFGFLITDPREGNRSNRGQLTVLSAVRTHRSCLLTTAFRQWICCMPLALAQERSGPDQGTGTSPSKDCTATPCFSLIFRPWSVAVIVPIENTASATDLFRAADQ